ncbi:EAL domain-containing protein [Propionivibrio sp.]|uniref:bifunctional diguanylate cyclase/phosphodiesterase n=1 Tax=Propionivibrio sp. TaxID=2212460 RepID=UPI00260782AC|nr:EAL domain-containing protein [Propionivibrio sp.]
MSCTVFPWRSLKTRVTLFTLLIFMGSLWALSYYASQVMRRAVEYQLGEQQFSTVTMVAAQLNRELVSRLEALATVADLSASTLQQGPAAMQALLEQRLDLHVLFNAGVYAARLDGIAIADFPLSAGRLGINYSDRDYIITALKAGKPAISRPVIGRQSKAPVFVMAVPIRNAAGKVVGALAGITILSTANFLDQITEVRFGITDGYTLIAPQYRLIVTSSNRSRIMRTLPEPGVVPAIDRFVEGYEGSAVYVNQYGVEVLASVKAVPVSGWLVSSSMHTDDAFAPIQEMRQRMLMATIMLTLLAGILSWWMLRRQLSPMLAAVKTLAALSDTKQPLQLLPVVRKDEIGELIGGFNRLLETLAQREALLNQILDTSSVAIFLVDLNGRITQANQRMAEMFGLSVDALVGEEYVALIHPSERELGRKKMQALIASAVQSVDLHRLYWRADRSAFWGHLTGKRFHDANGENRGLVGVIADINERKLTEQALLESESRFREIFNTVNDAIIIHDAETGHIIDVNLRMCEMYGFSRAQALAVDVGDLSQGSPPYSLAEANEKMRLARSEGPQIFDWQARSSDGRVFWVEVSLRFAQIGSQQWILSVVRDIAERKRAEDEIKQLAFYDQLTGLPNRRLLIDRLGQALVSRSRHPRQGALLFIDLDNFKTLNDTHGHDQGDLLLQQVAQRLTACVREGDTVARLGGDEFVVMLEDLSERAQEAAKQAEMVGEKILATLSQSVQLTSCAYQSTASIGITLFSDSQALVEELLQRADLAMYQAKSAGRNALRFFAPKMQSVVTARAVLETGLREAVLKNQFHLYYQAQLDSGGRVIGAEALIRWQHKERGLVLPDEFIPLSEETGLILPVGQWVLQAACAQLAAWATRPEKAHLTLAVNVSARQLHQIDFVDQVLAVLEQTGAPPQRLKLELTESMLVDGKDEIIARMNALKARGVGFSLDDFGTGYSSLSYLKRIPLDQLKIDRSFVKEILTDPNDAAIAKMVIVLAGSLGLTVIAEGVESEAQSDFLARQGCHAYQGYLFSRPLPLDEFEAFIERE